MDYYRIVLNKQFSSPEQYFTALFIITNYSGNVITTLVELIFKSTGIKLLTSEVLALKERIEIFPEMHGRNYFLKSNLKEELDHFLNSQNAVEFSTNKEICDLCNSSIHLSSSNPKKSNAVCYYFASAPKKAYIYIKECSFCDSQHYLNYAIKNGKKVFFEGSINDKFLAFTDESIFERLLLDSFTADLITKHSSFKR